MQQQHLHNLDLRNVVSNKYSLQNLNDANKTARTLQIDDDSKSVGQEYQDESRQAVKNLQEEAQSIKILSPHFQNNFNFAYKQDDKKQAKHSRNEFDKIKRQLLDVEQ